MIVSFIYSWPSRYEGISLLTVKRGFPKQKIAILSRKKFFGKKKPLELFFRGPFPPHLHKKSE